MPTAPSPLVIASLRGGMNNTDPWHVLPEDQCILAENVEFFYSALGERRNGCVPVSLTSSGLETYDAIVHLSQQFPTNDPNLGQIWAVGATEGVSAVFARRADDFSWNTVTIKDAIDAAAPGIYQIFAQSYQNKQFFVYPSAQDRLHVWDGSTIRRTGLAAPAAAPTVVDTGSGTYSGTRYFRTRNIEKSGSTILRRSEPSESVSITPSGSGAGAEVTRPTAVDEGETHWELEASADDRNYYLIATIAIATTTYTDTTASAVTYATFTVSEEIGEYLLQPAARFLLVDGDRLIGAGHPTDASLGSTIWWTPVSNDPGVGNDERLPLASLANNRRSLDNYEGGPITGVSENVNGVFYVFKWSHIYQATRTGNADDAYSILCLSKARGALPGSIVSGMDENGQACVYFLDPLAGPSRLGVNGLQLIHGLRRTWTRVNRLATKVVSHGVYYPEKRQVHWWVAADGADSPSLKLVLQVTEVRPGTDAEAVRGWSIATGRIAEALCSAIVNVTILGEDGSISTIARRPYIGLDTPDLLQQCDLLSTDAGQAYVAKIVTRPYMLNGLLDKWGAMQAAILANASTAGPLLVRCVRDFNKEVTSAQADFTPEGTEPFVAAQMDDLHMSDAFAIQFIFSDTTDTDVYDSHDITF